MKHGLACITLVIGTILGVIAASMNENGIFKIYTTNPKHFTAFNFVKGAIDPRQPT